VREWRDIHSQLHTVVAEHGWRLNGSTATYEQIHLALLAGLLGNVGVKAGDEPPLAGAPPRGDGAQRLGGRPRREDDDSYLGARGIRFWRHPGAHLSKKPGRWIVAAELVETTRLFGRGIAAIEPQWLPGVAGHLLKKQLLEAHWEKKAGEVIALERATLYGLVVYNNRRVHFARVDPVAARDIFIREALVAGDWDARLPFLEHNRKLVREVEELEHKSRRQDVLVDEELIRAFYDEHLPAEVTGGASLERWYGQASKHAPRLLMLSRDELMRHEAAGITTAAFPKLVRLGGVDCAASYLHAPGDARDGVTVTVPIYALNQVSEERCEWLVPGLLKEKVVALAKSLPQRPRSQLVPLPEFADGFVASARFAEGSLLDALLRAVRERTQLALRPSDFKLEQVPAHLFMNLRVVDEHGRQLAMGRHLAALKAELGTQARSAFQALAGLPSAQPSPASGRGGHSLPLPLGEGRGEGSDPHARYTAWTFGELPELMEIPSRGKGRSLVGFPALIDRGDHVEIEVFDEPQLAQAKHRAGLRRLVALQLKEPLKYLEKHLPELQKMAVAYMSLGTADELREQIIEAALERAFMAEPLPGDAPSFVARLAEGRPRLALVAQEVARLTAAILAEYAAAQRKLKESKPPKETADDVQVQLARLVGKRFVADTPKAELAHLPRYLKAVQMRLDKARADPQRDVQRLAELRPLEQAWSRLAAQRKGASDARLDAFRWQLEELRVGLFAQELRTREPVSVKRLERVWAQLAA
jgi:ATP-dependent helicase HrpA